MTNKTIEILIFLLGYLKENSFDDESLSEFSDNLVTSGYSEVDVADALGLLLEKLNFVPINSSDVEEQLGSSVRMLNDVERLNISPEVYGYLLKLRSLMLIDGTQMEKVIDYLMFSESRVIGETEINEIVAAIIFEDHMRQMGRDY